MSTWGPMFALVVPWAQLLLPGSGRTPRPCPRLGGVCVCVCTRRAVLFVDLLATSGLCYSVGAWDRLSKGQHERMQASLICGYRCAMSMPDRDPTKDRCASAEVLAACGKLGMSTRLSLACLKLLGPVLLHGPQALLRLCDFLVARDRGWPSLIVGDLDLVHLHLGEGSLGAGAAAMPAWADLVRGSPDVWERGLDRVKRKATAAHVGECLRLVWRRSLDGILLRDGIDLPGGSASVGVERGFLCCECGCALTTAGAWRTHRARVHGARHPARALAFGSICNGCCMELHTRPRLLWHLMYSLSSCLGAYASFFAPCDDATVAAAEHSDRVESRALRRAGEYDRVARLPAVRIHGCTLPPSARGLDSMKGVLPPNVPDGLGDCDVRRAPVEVHRYLDVTVYYVLHFFSGQRRPGDYQDWLDQSLAVAHYPVWVINLGVASDAKLCDLSCSGGVARWLDLAIAGRVVIVLGGPPCETWSVARWNGGSRATGSGPRAVRSSLHFGACMILTLVSASRSRSGALSCAWSSCSLQLPVCVWLCRWNTHNYPAGCLRHRPRGSCPSSSCLQGLGALSVCILTSVAVVLLGRSRRSCLPLVFLSLGDLLLSFRGVDGAALPLGTNMSPCLARVLMVFAVPPRPKPTTV